MKFSLIEDQTCGTHFRKCKTSEERNLAFTKEVKLYLGLTNR